MTFKALLKNRRAIRDFKEKEVPLDIIREILQESCLAPSASNGQPWRFIIINNREMLKKLSDECKKNILDDYLEKKKSFPSGHLDTVANEKYVKMFKNKGYNVFYNAPCLIYVVGSEKIISLDVDCALAVSYIMLSAAHRGLGTCWVNFGTFIRGPKIKKEIGIPDDGLVVAPVIIGYPKEIPVAPGRHSPQILKIIS